MVVVVVGPTARVRRTAITQPDIKIIIFKIVKSLQQYSTLLFLSLILRHNNMLNIYYYLNFLLPSIIIII